MGKRHRRHSHLSAVPRPSPAAQRAIALPASGGADVLVAAIAEGALDADLDRIVSVVSERMALLRAQRTIAVMAKLRAGDRVRINLTARPLYLQGALATVVGWAGQRVLVKLDQPVGRFANGRVRCPPETLDPVG